MISQSPKVSVCMITYGHEKFISQAIEGVLMQKINFDIELVISNDASPDKTHEVINLIIATHPKGHLIKYICQKYNIGMIPNFLSTLGECKGDFIAICEGDDYWTDSLKLQKQVDFLEKNKKYVIHSGNATYVSDDIKKDGLKLNNNLEDQTFVLGDFLTKNNLFTCTIMFRNSAIEFPESFKKITFGDWFLYVILLKSGKKAYKSIEVLSAYRVHKDSVMSSFDEISLHENHIFQVLCIKKFLKYKRLSNDDIAVVNNYFKKIYFLQLNKNKFSKAFKTFFRNSTFSRFRTPYLTYFKMTVKSFISNKKLC